MSTQDDSDIDQWVKEFSAQEAEQRVQYNSPTGNSAVNIGPGAISNQSRPFGERIDPNTQKDVGGIGDLARDIKDAAHQVGMGMLLAPAELAQGAAGLISPEAGDVIKGKINDIRRFQSENDIGGPSQLSQQAQDAYYGGGQLATAIAAPQLAMKGLGPVTTGALSGALGGLSGRQEGDTREDVLQRAGVGAAVGTAIPASIGLLEKLPLAGKALSSVIASGPEALSKTVGAVSRTGDTILDLASNYSDDAFQKGTAAVSTASKISGQTADDITRAFKKEIYPTYKALGIPIAKSTPEELLAQKEFIASFKGDYARQTSAKFEEALDNIKMPTEVQGYFTEVAKKNPGVIRAADAYMRSSPDAFYERAVQSAGDGTMRYAEGMRRAINEMPGASTGNTQIAADALKIMSDVSPAYKEAMRRVASRGEFADDLGKDLFTAIRSDNVRQIGPLAAELSKTPQGSALVQKTFLNGMRGQLVANSDKAPLQQLTATLGRNPQEISNTLDFLRQSGQTEIANKYEALTNFARSADTMIKNKDSIAAKMVGETIKKIDNQGMANAIDNLLKNPNNKWSKEFTTIMRQSGDSLVRTEKIANLLRRATGYVSGRAAGNIVNNQSTQDSGEQY